MNADAESCGRVGGASAASGNAILPYSIVPDGADG